MVNGEPTADYPAVVTLMAVDDAGDGANFCSGTLVAPGWVLTAGHCLEEMDAMRGTRTPNLVVAVGFDLGLEGGVQEVVPAADGFIPDDYDGATFLDDIGLIELATEITDVDPMPVHTEPPADCELGDDLRYVGWGSIADAEIDTTMKRTADIPLYRYDDGFLYGYDPEDDQNTCGGDSGGAALKISGDGHFELAAVNSYVSDDDDTPCEGGYTAGTRVDRHLAWIEQHTDVTYGTATTCGNPGGRSCGGCTTTSPAGSWIPVLLGLGGLARRLRA